MTQCIGHMGYGRYATLDFDHNEAEIFERDKGGTCGPLATVPFDGQDPVDEDHDPALDPDSWQNKNLLMFLHSDMMLKVLIYCRDKLAPRDEAGEGSDADFEKYLTDPGMSKARWDEDCAMLREIEEVLEWVTTVPE